MMSENTSTKIVDSVIIASCALPQSVLLFTAWWYKVVSATSIAGWFCGSRGAVGALGRRFQLQFCAARRSASGRDPCCAPRP